MWQANLGSVAVVLKKFGFSNSYSYHTWTELDMSAELSDTLDDNGLPMPVIPELFENVRKRGKGSKYGILPVAAIYGKNASGKTKLLNTLRDVALDALGTSFASATAHSESTPYKQILRQRQFDILSRKNLNPELCYSVCVVHGGIEYALDYTIGIDGVVREKLIRKILSGKGESGILYEREGLEYKEGVCGFINENLELMQKRKEMQLWFPLLAPADEGLIDFYEWFRCVRDGMNFNNNNYQDEKFENLAKRIAKKKDESFRNRLLYLLKHFDNSIVDIEGKDNGGKYRLWIYHNRADDTGRYAPLIEDESSGTRKLLEQFSLIHRCLQNGMPFICDEFDKMLHPVVFKHLVFMFQDSKINEKDAQLIFTAHDTFALDSDFLRRDEVHIADKDEKSISSITRLSEMGHVVSYADMENEFRTGYYGSVPANFHKSYGVDNDNETNT